jgi:SsrA-binding protein
MAETKRDGKKRPSGESLIADNRRARFDYEISDTLECGLELRGVEVKSLREKAVSFENAYAIVDGDELKLVGLTINRWKNASTHEELAPNRTRRLLASKREIEKLKKATQRTGLSIIPLRLYFKGPWAKVLIGLGKGKTHGDKRETIKRRESDREMAREMRRR